MIRRLDLIRHAHALPASPHGEAGRELSPEGIAAARSLGRNLRITGWRPEVVFSSPLARARQTAELLVGEQEAPVAIETMGALISEEDPAAVWEALEAAADGRAHVVAVGHQPLMGYLIERLAGQTVAVPPGSFHSIEFASGSGSGGRIVARAQAAS